MLGVPDFAMQAQNITTYYGHDHERLEGLLRQFEGVRETDAAAAQRFFHEFKSGLEQHIAWEEDILFPIFEAKTGLAHGGPTEVMRFEHRQIKSLLAAIHDKLAGQDASLGPDVTALKEVLSQHNQKEEYILYPATDELLSMAERDDVFAAMQRH